MITPTHTRRLAALLLTLGVVSAECLGGQPSRFVEEYRTLVQLGQNRQDHELMNQQYQKLSQMFPESGAVAYTHALLLTDQRRYGDAVRSSAEALSSNRGDLNLWKLHIWLQLQNEQFRPALQSVTELAAYMPDDSATGSRRERGEQMSEYFGTVAGYVAFPRAGDLPKYDVAQHCDDIRGRLTSLQQKAFDRGYERVRTVASRKAGLIEEHRRQAYDADIASREAVIAQMATERARIQDELAKLEDLRLQEKALASNERNTLAATRESFVSGAASRGSAEGVAVGGRRRFRSGPAGITRTRSGYVSAYDHDHRDASFAIGSSGFGAGAYNSVGRRGEDYDQHLTTRGDKLFLQLQVMQRKEVALRNKPAVGTSALVVQMTRRARQLNAYLALPVDPQAEVARLLTRLESSKT